MGFSDVFAALRREKQLSQRKVASDLKISQALLSHYENGLREPRLEFVVKACEYYGVSADYMLGRTAVRENPMLTGTGIAEKGELADMWTGGNMYSLINAITVMTNMIAGTYGEDAAKIAHEYFSVSAYTLFRYMKLEGDRDFVEMMKVPSHTFGLVCDRALKAVSTDIVDFVFENKENANEEYMMKIKKDFPSAYGMFTDWLGRVDSAINWTDNQRKKV